MLPKAFKSWPKSNKLPDLVTLLALTTTGYFVPKILKLPTEEHSSIKIINKFLYTKLCGPSQRNVEISVIFSQWHKSYDDVITKVMMTNPIELSSVIKTIHIFYNLVTLLNHIL